MDDITFDRLAKTLATSTVRRQALRVSIGGILAGALASIGQDAGAKKRGKRKGKKKNGGNQSPPPPPPPALTCSDGVKNGSESDVDCGGPDCPPCANGKSCSTRSDCLSDLCLNAVCQSCGAFGQNECGLAANGTPCSCEEWQNGGYTCSHKYYTVKTCDECLPPRGCYYSVGLATAYCNLRCSSP